MRQHVQRDAFGVVVVEIGCVLRLAAAGKRSDDDDQRRTDTSPPIAAKYEQTRLGLDAVDVDASLRPLPRGRSILFVADASSRGRPYACSAPRRPAAGRWLALGVVEADLDDVTLSFLGVPVRVTGWPRAQLRRRSRKSQATRRPSMATTTMSGIYYRRSIPRPVG